MFKEIAQSAVELASEILSRQLLQSALRKHQKISSFHRGAKCEITEQIAGESPKKHCVEKQLPEVSYKKSWSSKFRHIHRKDLQVCNFIKKRLQHGCFSVNIGILRLEACNFIQKRLQYRCFPVNIEIFLRTHILKKNCKPLLIIYLKTLLNVYLRVILFNLVMLIILSFSKTQKIQSFDLLFKYFFIFIPFNQLLIFSINFVNIPLVLNLGSYCSYKCSTKEAALRKEPLDTDTEQKMNFPVKGLYSKCEQIRSFLQTCLLLQRYLLQKISFLREVRHDENFS